MDGILGDSKKQVMWMKAVGKSALATGVLYQLGYLPGTSISEPMTLAAPAGIIFGCVFAVDSLIGML